MVILYYSGAGELGIDVGAYSSTSNRNGPLAKAGAGVGVSYGIKDTPLQVSVQAAGAKAEAGASFEYAGASAGVHGAEARAGPFAVRAGVKFGAGVRNGVPEIDLGPVTLPCCIQ